MQVHKWHMPRMEDALGTATLVVVLAGQGKVGIKRQGHDQLEQLFLLASQLIGATVNRCGMGPKKKAQLPIGDLLLVGCDI